MRDYETEMLAYVHLAVLACKKRQFVGGDKFLILAGAAACRAGWLDVAECCRRLVLTHNKNHIIGKHATFADALRSSDFPAFLKSLDRFCTYERAEYLLSELEVSAGLPSDCSMSAGEHALGALADVSDN